MRVNDNASPQRPVGQKPTLPSPERAATLPQPLPCLGEDNYCRVNNLPGMPPPPDPMHPLPPPAPAWDMKMRDVEGHMTPDGRLVRTAKVEVSTGDYSVDLKLKEDGTVGIGSIRMDGKNVSGLVGDAVKQEIEDNPVLWGPAALAGAGAVVAAHGYAQRTGRPITFDAGSVKLYQNGPMNVEAKPKAELAPTGAWVKPSGAELRLNYNDGPMHANAGLAYRKVDERTEQQVRAGVRLDEHSKWEATAGTRYDINPTTVLTTNAFYRPGGDYGVQLNLVSTF